MYIWVNKQNIKKTRNMSFLVLKRTKSITFEALSLTTIWNTMWNQLFCETRNSQFQGPDLPCQHFYKNETHDDLAV